MRSQHRAEQLPPSPLLLLLLVPRRQISPPQASPPLLLLMFLLLLLAQLQGDVQAAQLQLPQQQQQQHQRPLRQLSREETLFLARGIHVRRYNLSDEDARHSVTVSQRALLENRQSYAALRRLMKQRSLFHSFLRSLASLRSSPNDE